jgi:hypothetical protein
MARFFIDSWVYERSNFTEMNESPLLKGDILINDFPVLVWGFL